MNHAMVRLLVLKDWYFNRLPITGFLGVGAASLLVAGMPSSAAFFAGSVLLITLLISVGIHLAMLTILYERSNQTLAFVMSLPISGAEYTAAKLLANLMLFLGVWLAMLGGAVATVAGAGWLPDGMIPYVVVVLTQILAGYVVLLAVALVTESMGWSIAVIVTTNLLLQAVMATVSNIPAVAATLRGETPVWAGPVLWILAAQTGAILLALGMAVAAQARKTEFL